MSDRPNNALGVRYRQDQPPVHAEDSDLVDDGVGFVHRPMRAAGFHGRDGHDAKPSVSHQTKQEVGVYERQQLVYRALAGYSLPGNVAL